MGCEKMESVENTIDKLGQIENLDVFPEILLETSNCLKYEPGNVYKLSKIISKDQGITTKLLSIANSPFYGMCQQVSSLELAIMILGANELEAIVTALSLSEVIKLNSSEKISNKDFREHSLLVGVVARDMIRKFGNVELSGQAFIGGMLHDLGIQIIAKYFSREYDEILSLVKEGNSYLEAEKKMLGLSHQEIGEFIIKKWNLPSLIADTIEFHHIPSQSKINPKLVSFVHLADVLTREFNIGGGFWDEKYDLDKEIISLLDFSSFEELTSFMTESENKLKDTYTSLFN